VDVIVGTFSKSLASVGGFVAASEPIIHYLKHNARALIFSASPPPASVASVIAAIKIIQEEPERRELLWRNTHFLRRGLQELGLDTGASETPIIPVVVGDGMTAFKICRIMQDEGVFVNPVVPPAVQPGQSLIRFSVMSTHTIEQLTHALEIIAKISKQFHLEETHRADHLPGDHSDGSAGVSTVSVESAGI
jgi:7-keto-8-aminopelargonate synthetase-like enzyme